MNPSAVGWIGKLNTVLSKSDVFPVENNLLYDKLRDSGFIYGTNVKLAFPLDIDNKLTEEELSKTHLYISLLTANYTYKKTLVYEKAIDSIIAFYTEMESNDVSFFHKLLSGKKPSSKLEKIIGNRIQFDENILTKNFNRILTNVLLYTDVLTYLQFLEGNTDCITYARNLETFVINTMYRALEIKPEKNEFDMQLVKLFESSARYTGSFDKEMIISSGEEQHSFTSGLEKKYLLDLACLTVWNDKVIDKEEKQFVFDFGRTLDLGKEEIEKSIVLVRDFFRAHKDEISILNFSNPVKHFYDNSSRMVSNLILRNKKRLQQELLLSRELVVLLSKSTVKELTKEEKQKVKIQLLDICKSIPSLAIFLLPGGGILLPLLVKFIPQLLPSAFDDNKIS
ncbi:LETM1-related biofilm-associated protein [Sinomicrobium sp. M5D2P9]